MITDAILFILYWLVFGVTYPLRLLDTASLPTWITTAVDGVAAYMKMMVDWGVLSLPNVILIVAIFTIDLQIEGGYKTYQGIMWVIRKIPGIS